MREQGKWQTPLGGSRVLQTSRSKEISFAISVVCLWRTVAVVVRVSQNFSVLDRLTGNIQGAFAVVENWFDGAIEELHAFTL